MSKAENLAVMFTDIVGFSELTSSQSRDQNEAMLRQNEKLLLNVTKKFGGKKIKSIGDALLLVFRSPTDAVHCAMAMHDALCEYNQSVSEVERLSIRVSLNSGEVRLQSGDVFGEPVNVAARLEGITPANEVYFTEAIYLSMNKAEVIHEFVGKYKLKGIPEEVSVYRVPRGASVTRLVAVNEDGEDEVNQQFYPYGGMHLLEKHNSPNGLASFPLKQIAMAASIIIVVAVGAMFLPSMLTKLSQTTAEQSVDITQTDNSGELQQLLESADLRSLETRIVEILAENPDDPLALFVQGHLNFERRSYQNGIDSYLKALTLQPSLASDERYAENLVRGLTVNGAKITELVKLNPTEEVVQQLSERSVASGLSGRRDAAYLLSLINRQDKLDSVAMAILDLQESTSCEDRKTAIAIMKRGKDARALPSLEKITKRGFSNLFKNNCVKKDAREAISAIKGTST